MAKTSLILLGLAVVLSISGCAPKTGSFSKLRAALAEVRGTHGVNRERDAGPELTPVKQALRAWVEAQLPPAPGPKGEDGIIYYLTKDDLSRLSTRINQALDDAGLTCGNPGTSEDRCRSEPRKQDTERGYLGNVRIGSFDADRYLMVVTAIGVVCGFDESVYLYDQGPQRRWTLVFSAERDDYDEGKYDPQHYLSIDVSPSNVAWNEPAPLPLIAALGLSPWCTSNWNGLSTRLWRVSRTTLTPPPLMDKVEGLYRGDWFVAADHLTGEDLLIQFNGGSIDGGRLIRPHVEHYLIKSGDTIERVAPVALNPADFVDEWLTSNWQDAVLWLDPAASKFSLAQLHKANETEHLFGKFDGSPRQCRADSSLWQVSFTNERNENSPDSPPSYFKVRWSPPYDFTLVDASPLPFPGCDVDVATPSYADTLFPLQGWSP